MEVVRRRARLPEWNLSNSLLICCKFYFPILVYKSESMLCALHLVWRSLFIAAALHIFQRGNPLALEAPSRRSGSEIVNRVNSVCRVRFSFLPFLLTTFGVCHSSCLFEFPRLYFSLYTCCILSCAENNGTGSKQKRHFEIDVFFFFRCKILNFPFFAWRSTETSSL